MGRSGTDVAREAATMVLTDDNFATIVAAVEAVPLPLTTLIMAGFFLTLRHAGWQPGASTGPGTPLNHAYRQTTTVAWLGIVACQVGTAFAVRTDHASLRQVGVFTNKLLLAGIAPALVSLPAWHRFFGTAALSPAQLAGEPGAVHRLDPRRGLRSERLRP